MEEKDLQELEEIKEENEIEKVEEEQPEEESLYKVTINVRYDYRTMKYFNMYNMKYKKHFTLVYIIMGIVALGLAGWQIFTTLKGYYQSLDTEEPITLSFVNFIFPVVFVLFGAYFIYQGAFFEKTLDKNIQMHFYRNPKLVHLQETITDKYIAIRTSKNTDEAPIKYEWEFVNEIVELPEFIYLYLGKQPIIIDKDSNKFIEGDLDVLNTIIKEKASTKPYKRITKPLIKKPITYVHPEDQPELYDEAEVEEVNSDSNENNE